MPGIFTYQIVCSAYVCDFVASAFQRLSVRQTVFCVRIAKTQRTVYKLSFFQTKSLQIWKDDFIFIEPFQLIDPAASEVQLIRFQIHVFQCTGTISDIVGIAFLVCCQDQNRGIVMENIAACF